ncbi:cyclopropane-fatty-acyl-phospholipid synthase family protein [Gossypium australe]|uniref:Cyclopropane-fatty-acyl-phospholipid synthase family protein n=1 Tax=Gossypium australe TaxID=47621 RepID=A0A5B6WTY0_9ROSI|nr:cyclopropane-fatty-acyl-phospholipid synthase family protein [Gossypium australe]
MKIAVIGGGISGVVSAYALAKAGANVVLYEKEEYLGGHSRTVHFDGVDLDLGFMVFNRVTYPNMMELFESLGIDMEPSDMSLSVSLNEGKGCEWGSRNGLSGLFAQKSNLFNPYFWQMLREILKFKNDVISYLELLENNPDIDRNETLGQFIKSKSYSELFQKAYLVPVCGSIWSCPTERVMEFSAFSVLSFCRNHHLLQLFGRPQWMTVRWRSHRYVNKVREELESRGCQIRTGCEVHSVLSDAEGCTVLCGDDSQELYQGCIMAVHAPDALRLLGNQATYDESTVLGAFQYVYRTVLELPPTTGDVKIWEWEYLLKLVSKNLGETSLPFLVTLNPDYTPQHTLLKWRTGHPVPSVAATKASLELDRIQGKRGIWFCGAYLGYGFHEDGLKVFTLFFKTMYLLYRSSQVRFTSFQAGMIAANGLLGKSCNILSNPKHMVPSLMETGARLFVTRFLSHFISTGCVILLEEGGTMFTFEGTSNKCSLKTVIKVHSPHFYWKVMTEADLGLADSYINGDFSFVDKKDGLLNLVMSNDLFALFLDETMTYSCAVFKTEDEDLKDAQHRKISLLIEKARIDSKHEILEIGCGWGSLAIEVVKRTGCKYTGITLSEEQLKLAEKRVKEAGLQENIRFQLCDYRQLPSTYKYDRIISCEMIEAVGHEYMEDFFGCCESVLADDGLLVLQFISIPEQRYDEYRRSSDFIKEYIFPGGCLPSLARITTAMNAASRLCVEHVENIGLHYYQTLRYWRKNFMEKQSKIHALGFNDKFIRTWEYYFDYCAAGFKSNTLGNYQVVFSRPGNVVALGNPYKGFPSAS